MNYSESIYQEWKRTCKENELVIRGRIIGKKKGKCRDIIIVVSDKRYSFMIPKDLYSIADKGDIIAVHLVLVETGELWLFADRYMIICRTSSQKAHEDLQLYPRNDRNEKENFHLRLLNDEKGLSYLQVRSIVMNSVREYLGKNGFLDNSVSNIQRSYYGGNAIPFITHVNYLHKDCYLKPNSQIPFIICLAGGIERMYEVSEYFRNGGTDDMHTVPYTAIEIMCAYTSYQEIKDLTMALLYHLAVRLEESNIPCLDIQFLRKLKYGLSSDFRKLVYGNKDEFYSLLSEKNVTYEESKQIYNQLKKGKMSKMEKLYFLDYLPDCKSPFIKTLESDNKLLYRGFAIVNSVNVIEYFEGETDPCTVLDKINSQKKDKEKDKYEVLKNALELGIPQYSYITISIDRIISFILGEKNLQKYKMMI